MTNKWKAKQHLPLFIRLFCKHILGVPTESQALITDVEGRKTDKHSSCPQGISSLMGETGGKSIQWEPPGVDGARGEVCSGLSSLGLEEGPLVQDLERWADKVVVVSESMQWAQSSGPSGSWILMEGRSGDEAGEVWRVKQTRPSDKTLSWEQKGVVRRFSSMTDILTETF